MTRSRGAKRPRKSSPKLPRTRHGPQREAPTSPEPSESDSDRSTTSKPSTQPSSPASSPEHPSTSTQLTNLSTNPTTVQPHPNTSTPSTVQPPKSTTVLPTTNSIPKLSDIVVPDLSNLLTKLTSNVLPKPTTLRIPPIILSTNSWRKVAPSVYKLPELKPSNLIAKTSNGNIHLLTSDPSTFRLLQKTLLTSKTDFHTFNLPEERSLKVVLRGIPTDITDDEVISELATQNFQAKLVRRFGTPEKPLPLVLVHLSATPTSKDIFQLDSLFYLKISVQPYQSSGPAQCFACQRFGHGSPNCGYPLRCVKCAGNHSASKCPKTRDQKPKCCNCGGDHTANYRGCPHYAELLKNEIPSQPTTKPVLTKNQVPQIQTPPLPSNIPQTINYASAVKNSKPVTTPTSPPTPPTHPPRPTPSTSPVLNMGTILNLLMDLLTALSSDQDPKILMQSVIKTFISIISSQNV